MDQDASLSRYRTASRRALVATVAVLAVLVSALVWNARQLEDVEARLQTAKTALSSTKAKWESLLREREGLTETLRSLRDAPDGGVRALAQRVNVAGQMHDFTIWVDTTRLSRKVKQVTYEFAGSGYETLSSSVAATGFAAYFRGPVRPGQPVCPGRTTVTITFDDASVTAIDYDLCAELGV